VPVHSSFLLDNRRTNDGKDVSASASLGDYRSLEDALFYLVFNNRLTARRVGEF
jgi:hypothetical protein